MKTVLLNVPGKSDLRVQLLRQTPGERGEWNGYKFYLNESPQPCDYTVAFAGQKVALKSRTGNSHTLFIAGEPPAIKRYNEAYLAQFGSVISPDSECAHPNLKLTQQGHPWFCGRKFLAPGKTISVKSYDDYASITTIEKTKLISVVCSDKQSTPGHKKRFDFIQKLKQAFGDELDLFGTGIEMVEDKADAIRPYQYHIAIENSAYPHYWTEKLSDCYLEGAFPFYAGCPNVDDYFRADAYCVIDLDNPEGTIEKIRDAITLQRYQKSLKALQQAKQQVLNDYNLFNLITEHFDHLQTTHVPDQKEATIFPPKYFKKGSISRFFQRNLLHPLATTFK